MGELTIKIMDKNTFELSPRYYPTEIIVWLLGAVLIFHKPLGINLEQLLTSYNIKLQIPDYVPHIFSVVLFLTLLYLFLEFKQSQEEAKKHLLTRVRVTATIFWAIIALWLFHPELVKNTVYEGISPAWYLGFLGIGILLGFLVPHTNVCTVWGRGRSPKQW